MKGINPLKLLSTGVCVVSLSAVSALAAAAQNYPPRLMKLNDQMPPQVRIPAQPGPSSRVIPLDPNRRSLQDSYSSQASPNRITQPTDSSTPQVDMQPNSPTQQGDMNSSQESPPQYTTGAQSSPSRITQPDTTGQPQVEMQPNAPMQQGNLNSTPGQTMQDNTGAQASPDRITQPSAGAQPQVEMQPNAPASQSDNLSQPSGQRSSNALSEFDRRFMEQAAQSDMTEIMTSRLALERSSNPQVQAYAQRMVEQHTDSSARLQRLAQQKNVTLPRQIGSENEAMLQQLQGLQGAQFDQAYMNGQLSAHTKAEDLYQQAVAEASDPDVKAFASAVRPLISQHRSMAESMVAGRAQ